jgi:hypothetical protein
MERATVGTPRRATSCRGAHAVKSCRGAIAPKSCRGAVALRPPRGGFVRLIAIAAFAMTLAGCALAPLGSRNAADQGRTGLGWKTVARKVEPAYLVATDQTSCTVSSERFRDVRVGQRVLCNWQDS